MYDSFKTKKTLKIGKKTYTYYSFKAAEKNGLKNISALPFSIKVILENLIRNEDGSTVELNDIKEFEKWKSDKKVNKAPKVVTSNASNVREDSDRKQNVDKRMTRLKKSGHIKDAQSVLKEMYFNE